MRTAFDALGPFIPGMGAAGAPDADDEPRRQRYRERDSVNEKEPPHNKTMSDQSNMSSGCVRKLKH